jgi:para-aminobenzoate synthetase/4-amino-4-deoxychorismate lyase
MNTRVLFLSPPGLSDGWSLSFESPCRILRASRLDEVAPVLREVETAANQGLWTALVLSYEAAPAFDAALATHAPGDWPLLWAGIFEQPSSFPDFQRQSYELGAWSALVSNEHYKARIRDIREAIRQGEAYQVNYTIPFEAPFSGDSRTWFHDLVRAQGAGYSAFFDLGDRRLLSLSPELFFRRHGEFIQTKPMKGTMPRGRFLEEDRLLAARLASCSKNQAENVMIVDLLRNDLGKLAKPGSVRVTTLFEVERYPTVHQMVSTVEARLKHGIGLYDILAALFPCGSVTGAPKASAMAYIKTLESSPRGAYCGAVGYVAPGGDCVFNVPIRTVTLDSRQGKARAQVGGGVTWDSTDHGEYEECLVKLRFAEERRPCFSLFETVLLEDGEYFLQDWHRERLAASARYFGFSFDRERFEAVLSAAATPSGRYRVKLSLDEDGGMRVASLALGPRRTERVLVDWAPEPVNFSDVFLFHKTTRRELYEANLAARPDAQDVLLYNERGELTESCRANVVLKLDGRLWTPARESGLLAGTFRAALLAKGVLRERSIQVEEVSDAQGIWLINSVRRWMRVRLASPSPFLAKTL